MRLLLGLLLLSSATAFAQEDADRPRHRAQAFLIPMDENARTPTTRVATAVETVLLRTPIYEVVEIAPRKGTRQSLTLSATPTAASLSQLIAGASDEVGRGTAGKSVSALAQRFSLERVLIGSVRSQEESHVSVVLALVDAVKHRIIAAKTLTLSADGTDADQIELDTQTAARKLIAADDAEAETAADAPAAAEPIRKPVMPGAIPAVPATADEPGLVGRGRRVAIPAPAPAPASQAELRAPNASEPKAEPPAPASKEAFRKKQKAKGLQGKTGTEEWGDD